MRRNPAILCLLLAARAPSAVAAGLSAQAMPSPDSYEEDLAGIAALGVREENSPGEKAAFSYIAATLGKAGIDAIARDFEEARGGYSSSRMLEAVIRGARVEELVFIVPVSSWHDATSGDGGAAGLALALSSARRVAVSGRRPALTLRFVFLGAERRGRAEDGEEASLGTRTWIDQVPTSPRSAVVYLSLDPDGSAVSLRNAGKGVLSPLWHFDRARKALESSGIPLILETNRLQVYRLGLADRYGPAAPYLAAGIPAVELRSARVGAGAAIDGARYASLVDSLIAENSAGYPESWDLHYLIFELGRFGAAVRETTYVGFVVAAFAAAAALVLGLTITRRAAAKSLLARSPLLLWQVAALYAALAAVYLAGTVVARIDALALGSSDAWRITPRIFGGARILSSMLLFLAFISLLVERGALTSNPYFYEFAALLCLGVDVFAFSAVNLPVSFLFLWAFAIVGASLATRRGWATIAAYGLMYAPVLLIAVDLVDRPEYKVYSRLIAPGVLGSLALAAVTLPFFVFTVSPLLFFAPHGALARKRTAALLAVFAIAVEGSALLTAATGFATRGSAEAKASVSEAIDQDAGAYTAVLKARRRLGAGTILRGSSALAYSSTGDEDRLAGLDAGRYVSWAQDRTFFLDRCTDRVRLDFESPPFMLVLRVRSESELDIYDCGLPYRVSLDGKSAEIFAQANPGRSLTFPITFPRGFEAALEITAEYLEPLLPYSFPDGSAPKPGRFTVRATMNLAGGG